MTLRRTTITRIEPLTKNTLGVDGQAYAALLHKLDDNTGSHPTSSERVYRRLGYAKPRLLLRIESDRDTAREIIVASRNLSQRGISILHASYMYNDTPVTIDLACNDGSTKRVRGSVTRCVHRGGIIHEVGIRFDHDINLRQFLHGSPDLLLHAHERIEPESLESRVLFLSADNDFSPLIRQAIDATNIKHNFRSGLDQSLPTLHNQDMIVLHHTDELQAPDAVARLRAAGFTAPIIIAAPPMDDTQAHLLSACGADSLIPWPCDTNTLTCAIAEYELNDWTPESLALLRSCVEPETRRILGNTLATRGVKLDQHARTQDTQAIIADCQAIQQLARPLNLEPIHRVAASIAQRLETDDHETAFAEAAELARACTASARKKAA